MGETRTLRGGRYEILGPLGEGTQAETFSALDAGAASTLADKWSSYVSEARGGTKRPAIETRGKVAIKCFRVGKAKAWKDVELAEREATTLRELDHPSLPRYVEHFEEEGALYLVMEKIEGESLATIRARGGRSSVAEVERMLHDIGGALRYLHGRSPPIVHRDIKPGNVIRRPDGSFALVDFGAVRDRLRPSGGSTVVGTFGFMAPEQFQGRASGRSDLYGLAATALVMLTGEEPEDLPHEGLGIEVARAVPDGTPRPLVRALTAMLVPDPDRRVASIDEALALLAAAPDPIPAREEAPAREPKKKRRKESRRERRARQHGAKLSERFADKDRALLRARRPPFLPRFLARFALVVSWVVVWLTVGIAVPTLLFVLSLLFGPRLRQAAEACFRAEKRAKAALGRASLYLSGHRGPDIEGPHVRVEAEDEGPRRVAVDEDPGAEAESWLEERLEAEHRRRDELHDQRERMRMHAQRKHWGR